MESLFPMEFSLDNGTLVTVHDMGGDQYDFTLKPEEGAPRSFTYVEGERTKAEWDEIADFDQLQALRTFWLNTETEE